MTGSGESDSEDGWDSDHETDGDTRADRGASVSRAMMIGALVLALASTGLLVFTDSAQWLRFGVLAALWAAVLAIFLAVRYRRQASERENEAADLQSVYEVELEREIAARREHELQLEVDLRREIEEERQHDLELLRAELQALRDNLEQLNSGEVLVERFALQARSTRMRSWGQPPTRVISAGGNTPLKSPPVLPAAHQDEPETPHQDRPPARRPHRPADRQDDRRRDPASEAETRRVRPVNATPSSDQPRTMIMVPETTEWVAPVGATEDRPVEAPAPPSRHEQRPAGAHEFAPARAPRPARAPKRAPEPSAIPGRAPAPGSAPQPAPAPELEPDMTGGAHAAEDGSRAAGRHGGEARQAGAHAAGTSVTELLAGFDAPATSHRRRRRED